MFIFENYNESCCQRRSRCGILVQLAKFSLFHSGRLVEALNSHCRFWLLDGLRQNETPVAVRVNRDDQGCFFCFYTAMCESSDAVK